MANFIDNINHGAAIGGSFTLSPLIGLTTLIAILIHEIPHEIGDFTILLQSGFDRIQAIKAQLITGSGALLGASLAIYYSTQFHCSFKFLHENFSFCFQLFFFLKVLNGFYHSQVELFFIFH